MSTLRKILDGEVDIAFNVDLDEFTKSNPATEKNPSCYRVSDLWDPDPQNFHHIRQAVDHRVAVKLEQVRDILKYRLPVVVLKDTKKEDAVEAFVRINTRGVRLGKAEIESARLAGQHEGFVRDYVVPTLATCVAKDSIG